MGNVGLGMALKGIGKTWLWWKNLFRRNPLDRIKKLRGRLGGCLRKSFPENSRRKGGDQHCWKKRGSPKCYFFSKRGGGQDKYWALEGSSPASGEQL